MVNLRGICKTRKRQSFGSFLIRSKKCKKVTLRRLPFLYFFNLIKESLKTLLFSEFCKSLLLLLLLFITFSLDADDKNNNVSQIEANDVDYDGKKIRLAGDVRIEHSFGELYCQRAVVILQKDSEKRSSADRILLDGDVKVILRNGAHLTSQEADLDCNTLEAVFAAASPEKVVYVAAPEEGAKGTSMRASSRAMRVKMKKNESSEYDISDVQGEDAVMIEYLNSLTKDT